VIDECEDVRMAGVAAAGVVTENETEVKWDGRQHSYRPGADWTSRISPDLEFYVDSDEELDPVTFEVIRNRLWTMNLAHGATLTRISGSPVFQALDFNMAIMTGEGEIVMNAPYLQALVAGVPLAVRYIMENLSEDPGIEDGDMFLSTDPWVGAVHQMDVLIAAPVFVDGKLFAWVTNAGHQYDLGGIVPGGWPQNAPDVYSEPVVLPPFKIVEKGVMRHDLELMYRRQSRMPDLVALDLRAQISGCRFAASQLKELCEQFGAATVRAAMARILDAAQASFQRKLEKIPDGTWSEVRYFDEKMPGDRSTYRMQITAKKTGDRIAFYNEGTDPQADGPLNIVYAALSGQILGVLAVTMLYEQMFSIGGAERQIDFELTPGLITCADYPAAISGGVLNIVVHTNAVMQVVGRMLASSEELREDVIAGGPGRPLVVLAGTNDRGTYFGTALMDGGAMGSGARSYRDGIDTSGPTWNPLTKLLNVEGVEQWYPLVYLYRRERVDSGGAGRWRGGVGMEFAFMPYRAESIEAITNTGGQDISTHGAMGLFGGFPSPTAHYTVVNGTNVLELLAAGTVPGDLDELEMQSRTNLRGKSNGTVLLPGDVVETTVSGGGGYGDPLDRDPGLVATDVQLGYVSSEVAAQIYGVALDPSTGQVDADATEAWRTRLRDERRQWRRVSDASDARADVRTPATGTGPVDLHEYVQAIDSGDHRVLACKRCGHELSDYAENFKSGLLVDESPVTLIPQVQDPSEFLDDVMVFRRYCCPGCHTLFATDLVRPSESPLDEMLLQNP
jgi:N-methylhydantoinase B